MRPFLLFSLLLFAHLAFAQMARVKELSLPPAIAQPDNQVSGLYIAHKSLFLLAESRLQDRHLPRVFSIALSDIKRKLKDTAYTLPYRSLPIAGLQSLREKMDASGNLFEGIESMIIEGNSIYFNVETSTASPYCFLLRGLLDKGQITMTEDYFPVKKPRLENGKPVFNAGFEAMAKRKNTINMFYEYNYFRKVNFVYRHAINQPAAAPDAIPINPLPFRITDITRRCGRNFVGVNYFFRGDTMENGYVIDSTDSDFRNVYKDGKFVSFARLVNLRIKKKNISWRPYWSMPDAYHNYNWEGIAKYKQGYFLVNDKYTPDRPYTTKLIYLSPN